MCVVEAAEVAGIGAGENTKPGLVSGGGKALF